jgi:nucleotide-binding universal stress UspA family protein
MQSSIEKIILATDFSETSEEAGFHAMLLVQTYNAELKALHVFEPRSLGIPYHKLKKDGQIDEDPKKTRQRGKTMLKELADSFHVKADTIFAEGDPGHEIVRVAEELNADLIVLGTHGYTGWKRFALGSVAELVVRHAPCAVLTIRPKEKQIEPTHRKKLAVISN